MRGPRTYAVSREERITHVVRLIREGRWSVGLGGELAAEWGVPLVVAEHSISDAKLVLRVAERYLGEEAREELLRRFGAHLAGA